MKLGRRDFLKGFLSLAVVGLLPKEEEKVELKIPENELGIRLAGFSTGGFVSTECGIFTKEEWKKYIRMGRVS